MPLLSWRTDADGFIFDNTWTFDPTEQNTLAGIAGAAAPAAVAAVVAAFPPLALDPVTLGILTATASAVAAGITATAKLPTYGLCGGMTYASTDYWLAKAELPCGGNFNDHPTRTAASSGKLRDMLWKRLITSLTSGGCLQQTIEWSLVLNQLPAALGGGGGTLLSWTAKEWPKIRATIDAGRPCPIGLIYTTREIWYQHQILVYGYEVIGNGGRLHVYDSYFPHAFGQTADDPKGDYLTFDLSGPVLKATSPSDKFGGTLAGFFTTNYSAVTPPANLATSFGEFITFDGKTNWMTAYGAILPLANAAELTALGGVPTDPRPATPPVPVTMPHPRDGALLRERSSAPVFLYQGGSPFWVPDPTQLTHFGGWSAVRVVPDKTIAQFAGFPVNGTLIHEFSDTHVFLCLNGGLSASTVPSTSVDARPVPDNAIRALLLDKVSLDYASIQVGGSCHGTVSLKTAFPGADTTVTLTSSQPTLATVPATVTILKGTTSADFILKSTGVAPASQGYAVQVTATVADHAVSASLLLEPPRISQFLLSPQTVTAGQSSTATLVLSAPYSADLVVNLFSYSTFADVPATVTIPKNATSVNFTVTTPALNYAFPTAAALIQASYANITATATLTVQSLVVAGIAKSITLFPDPVTSGGSTTATVTLVAAVNVPTDVSLTSQVPGATIFAGSSPLVATMPNLITIPAGQTQGKFTIKTASISSQVTKRTATIVAIAVKEVTASLTLS